MDEWVAQMFNWASIINSSINIVVYIWLNKEFRYQFARAFNSKWLHIEVRAINAAHVVRYLERRSPVTVIAPTKAPTRTT
ncbi:unnamed protein product [Cylicostephanus goldi]|uniref:G-protein coupled receptors family 1 profile domain-containing protein n=1 Tax=Cylicostephanus goldi TaxID=71465 RepID=A0A3P7QC34_CYLGO|nr:unnamed protein product [Cylicostephanus goldi]